jgi:hypothetical protein
MPKNEGGYAAMGSFRNFVYRKPGSTRSRKKFVSKKAAKPDRG